jgi:hypothetical protein
MPDPSREAALAELLMSLFDERGLRRFLRYGPDGAALYDELPSAPTEPAELAHQVVLCLIRRGLVNRSLFDRLRAERSERAADIEAVAQRWSGHLQPSRPVTASRAARPMVLSAVGLLLIIICALLLLKMRPGTPPDTASAPVGAVITPQTPEPVLPVVTDLGSATAPRKPATAVHKETVRASDTIPARSTVSLKADGAGSVAVGGNLNASADKVTIDASDGATGVKKDATIIAHDASVTATGGATAVEGNVDFEAHK